MTTLGVSYGDARKLSIQGRASLGEKAGSDWTEALQQECQRLYESGALEEKPADEQDDKPPEPVEIVIFKKLKYKKPPKKIKALAQSFHKTETTPTTDGKTFSIASSSNKDREAVPIMTTSSATVVADNGVPATNSKEEVKAPSQCDSVADNNSSNIVKNVDEQQLTEQSSHINHMTEIRTGSVEKKPMEHDGASDAVAPETLSSALSRYPTPPTTVDDTAVTQVSPKEEEDTAVSLASAKDEEVPKMVEDKPHMENDTGEPAVTTSPSEEKEVSNKINDNNHDGKEEPIEDPSGVTTEVNVVESVAPEYPREGTMAEQQAEEHVPQGDAPITHEGAMFTEMDDPTSVSQNQEPINDDENEEDAIAVAAAAVAAAMAEGPDEDEDEENDEIVDEAKQILDEKDIKERVDPEKNDSFGNPPSPSPVSDVPVDRKQVPEQGTVDTTVDDIVVDEPVANPASKKFEPNQQQQDLGTSDDIAEVAVAEEAASEPIDIGTAVENEVDEPEDPTTEVFVVRGIDVDEQQMDQHATASDNETVPSSENPSSTNSPASFPIDGNDGTAANTIQVANNLPPRLPDDDARDMGATFSVIMVDEDSDKAHSQEEKEMDPSIGAATVESKEATHTPLTSTKEGPVNEEEKSETEDEKLQREKLEREIKEMEAAIAAAKQATGAPAGPKRKVIKRNIVKRALSTPSLNTEGFTVGNDSDRKEKMSSDIVSHSSCCDNNSPTATSDVEAKEDQKDKDGEKELTLDESSPVLDPKSEDTSMIVSASLLSSTNCVDEKNEEIAAAATTETATVGGETLSVSATGTESSDEIEPAAVSDAHVIGPALRAAEIKERSEEITPVDEPVGDKPIATTLASPVMATQTVVRTQPDQPSDDKMASTIPASPQKATTTVVHRSQPDQPTGDKTASTIPASPRKVRRVVRKKQTGSKDPPGFTPKPYRDESLRVRRLPIPAPMLDL